VIRDAYLSEYEISNFEKGNLTAIITAMYQKSGPHLDDVLYIYGTNTMIS